MGAEGAGVRALPTVLVGARQLRGAARPVTGGGEAQHRGEVLSELLQARHKAHVDAVLKVGPGGHHGNLLFLLWLPGHQLRRGQPLKQGGSEHAPAEAQRFPTGWANGQRVSGSPAFLGSLLPGRGGRADTHRPLEHLSSGSSLWCAAPFAE